jgi:PncC family amidohydrolase
MARALALAERGAAAGEVPVGALVVRGEEVLGEGWNRPIADGDATAHAEMVALRAACAREGNYRLPGTTLYVTMEPCPMCAGAIVHARIARVVFGARDEKWGAAGSIFEVLGSGRLNHRPEVSEGVLAEASAEMLRAFFRARRDPTSAPRCSVRRADPGSLGAITERAGRVLARRGLRLACAESCTGGLAAQAVTAVPGSSAWFDRGFVAYSNDAKREMLGVREQTLAAHGAVSEETVREMAAGALARSNADLAIAISGVAGPGGGTPAKPVGTVCIAWAARDGRARSRRLALDGDRDGVRAGAVAAALDGIEALIGDDDPGG